MPNLLPKCFALACALLLISASPLAAAEPATRPTIEVPLWPSEAPGEKGNIGEEFNRAEGEGKLRITNVTKPTITVYHPDPGQANGAAVLVCPGGAYHVLAADIEGEAVCDWLNSMGITAVMLKYRVPRREGREKHEAPLEDAQRAMGLIRQHADEWKIDPDRIGVIGFSAGGHLAVMLSNTFQQRTYPPVDAADELSCRPDFAMPIYPFYLTSDEDPSKLSPEIRVTEKTPPTFMVMTQDDRIHYVYVYALALKQAQVPAELHVYAEGGHGFGLGRKDGPTAAWPKLAETWLRAGGWLTD